MEQACETSEWPKNGKRVSPLISIIIPVLNEQAHINATLRHLRALRNAPQAQIIVVDGCPTESTIRAINGNHAATLRAPRGRGSQMNRGADCARGQVLLFLHADTRLPPNALDAIERAFNRGDMDYGAFELGIASPRKCYRLIEWMVHWRTRFTRVPYGDQAIFMRRRFFTDLGGYRKLPLMEDVDLMRRARQAQGQMRIIATKALTAARRWEKEGVVYCTLRNWILMLLYLGGVPVRKIERYYRF